MLCLSLFLLTVQNPDLERVSQWMKGFFDTSEQVYRDEQAKASYQHVRAILKIKPVELPGLDLARPYRAFYLEQALAGSSDKPYLQRVVVLTNNEQGELQSLNYQLAGRPDAITKETITRESGCDVTWTKLSDDRFQGKAGEGGTCKTTLRGATHVVSSVELTPNSFTWLDQGFDATGAHKWGPPPGAVGHSFRKQPEWKPTSDSIRMTMIDAAPYRNKVVRLRAKARLNAPNSGQKAQLWLRVDRAKRQMGFFDNMQDRPIYLTEWKPYEITGPVAADAERIAMGIILVNGVRVELDDVAIEIVGQAPTSPIEAARPLTPPALDRLKAFARLYGYVRFFHPTLGSTKADWNALALDGVRVAEEAADAADLAARLTTWLKPVAPAVQFWPSTQPAPAELWRSAEGMVRWQHHGFGLINPNAIYHSDLVEVKPGTQPPFRTSLGAGIDALIPMAMPAFEKAVPAKSYIQYSGEDRTARLAGVIIAWNILQHFYPYFDVVHTDWPAELDKALVSAANDSDGAAFETTLRRMVAALHDGHGNVRGSDRSAVSIPLRLGWVEGRVINGDTGDTILTIDGRPAPEALREQELLISGATPQWIRYQALSQLGSGPVNTEAVLEVEPLQEPGTRRTAKLTRVLSLRPQPKRPGKIAELEPGIWYVDLTRIKDDDWKQALDKLKSAKGIVFDLRGYPSLGPAWLSHLSESSLKSAQWHIPLVTQPDRVDLAFQRAGEWNLPPLQPYLTAKRAVMTNGSAISYAESTMGIVEHYHLSEIVGESTAGTNGNVNWFELPGGYRVNWTGMKVLKQDGSQHHGVGIQPTVPVTPTRAGIAAGRDEVLERAVAAVR